MTEQKIRFTHTRAIYLEDLESVTSNGLKIFKGQPFETVQDVASLKWRLDIAKGQDATISFILRSLGGIYPFKIDVEFYLIKNHETALPSPNKNCPPGNDIPFKEAGEGFNFENLFS